MNMKKTFGVKKLTALLFPLALAVVLAACGGTGSPANGGADSPVEPAPSHPDNIGYINVGGRNIDIRATFDLGNQRDDLMNRLETTLLALEAHPNFPQLRIIEITEFGPSALTPVVGGIFRGMVPNTGELIVAVADALNAGFPA